MKYSRRIMSFEKLRFVPSIITKDTIPTRTRCIEPNCVIECTDLYTNDTSVETVEQGRLTLEQAQHLLIDLGEDAVVNEMINDYPKPKLCPLRSPNGQSTNRQVEYYPMSFGFVENRLPSSIPRNVSLSNGTTQIVQQTCLPKKTIDFSLLIPGQKETYTFGFGQELDYRRVYGSAYFALTKRKGGWDCNRHYEIISSGTMPYFERLEFAGALMMKHLPKPLLLEARNMPGVHRQNMTIDHKLFNHTQYNLLLHRLLYYAKRRLTTTKLVEYILTTIKYPYKDPLKNHSILYISHPDSDFQKDYILHGFTLIFERDVHVYEPAHYLYEYPVNKQWSAGETLKYYKHILYGLGYGYALSLRKYFYLYKRDKEELGSEAVVRENINSKRYSLIVFGAIYRRNALFSLVAGKYNCSQIVLIDGEDEQRDVRRSEYAQSGTYFLREVPDDCNAFT
ncbi:unnamed protein product [Didymodactylos carnosus]|uniref:Uncharacterized protein n=1 Tax=Didymodactylos carnosus TaxID=1234261 RepID=A0A8S2E1D7_9BILA|nr:unnamed protein product [Didymodactylos carnosus]CAF3827578.1 unnamed protein product [Didymodactylos carnosus]